MQIVNETKKCVCVCVCVWCVCVCACACACACVCVCDLADKIERERGFHGIDLIG